MKNKFSMAMSLAMIVAMLVTSLALADNLKDDAATAGNDTFTAGGSTTIKYWIQAVGGCDASDGSSATVTINVPAGVTVSPSSLTFSSCNTQPEGNPNNTQNVIFSSSTAGDYSITATVTDSSGSYNTSPAAFTLHVTAPTNTAPSLSLPSNITAEATSAAGAVVTYTATATDAQDDPDPTPSCSPASGSTFPLGTTTVNCSVTDSGGMSASGSFTITVQDTTAPVLSLPSSITAEATSSAGAVVTYSASANDSVDGAVAVNCSPASGSTFALGTTTVNCSASDAAGNTSNASFSVSVVDTTPPTVTVPANMTIEATGPSGAVATFSASASDLVDGPLAATCSPASGSTFPLATTTVSCSATDAAGNTGSASFTVTVQDTTAPTLTLPANMTVSATSASGAVVTFSASATDIVDGSVAVSCTPSSGSTFAPGTTTVTCSATDAAGNTANGSFTVSVKFQLPGFYQPVDMSGVYNTVKGGSTVPLKFEVFAGSTELTATSVVKSFVQTRIACDTSATIDEIEVTSTGGTSLRYDTTGGQFIQNWQTPKQAGACYRVTLTTQDDSSLVAFFRLK